MLKIKSKFGLAMSAIANRKASIIMPIKIGNRYFAECRGPDGELKWRDFVSNLIVDVGLDDILDKYLKGSNYTAAHYMGLIDGSPTVDPGDTMGSHAGWTEVTAYDEAVRQTVTWGAVSGKSVDNSGSPAVFTISANNTTLGGLLLSTNSTKGGSSDILYGAGPFDAGNKIIDDNDTLTITVISTGAAS